MFLNKSVVLSNCFLILLMIVFPLFVRVNAENKKNTLVKVLKNILPRSSLAEDINKESMAFNPVIHDQLETIFKQNNERRSTNEYTTNTSTESPREQDSREKNNSQTSTHQETTRVKNARTNAYGTSNQDMELDNLIDHSSKKEISNLAKTDIRNDSLTLETVKSEKNAFIQGINSGNVPSNEAKQSLLNNETLVDPGKDIREPLVVTVIDEKVDVLNLEEESEPMRQLKANKIGLVELDLEKDKGDPSKTVRQDNRPNRQSKLAKTELGSVKSDESCPPDHGILHCETNFTLNLTERTITSWKLLCSYFFIKDQVRISVSLTNASDTNSYALELRTPKSDYKTERKEDNLHPFCIPSDDSYSMCLYFGDSIINQPKLVTLHPYLVHGENLEYLDKTLQLGTLDLSFDEYLKKKHIHHDFMKHTHDSKHYGKELHDWKHDHHFGKLEIESKYDRHNPLVQFWNPNQSGGDNIGHYHNHNDDPQYSSSHQSNVYHHSNAPLFTPGNHGNAPLFTRGNLGNGYDSNLHSNVVQNNPESFNRDNAFDKQHRSNGASYSSGSHGNDINYYSGNQGNQQYINSPEYSPGYRNVKAYNSEHHGNAEHSSSGNYDNDRKVMSSNGWEPIIGL